VNHIRASLSLGLILVVGCGSPTSDDRSTTRDVPSSPESVDANTDPAHQTAVDTTTLAGMLLHLPDAPAGARLGDDSHCGDSLSTEGQSDPFLDLVDEAAGAIVGCFTQLESADVFINSLVVTFPNDDLATRGIEATAFEGIVRYFGLGCCANELPDTFESISEPDASALQATTPSDAVAIIGWRLDNLIGAVSVLRTDGSPGALAEAQRLADVQADRMRSPVELPAAVDDDRLVGLQMAPFATWWLGDTFAPPGLPEAKLFTTYYRDGLAELDYTGIRIEIFDRSALADGTQPAEIVGVADDLFDSPCTVRTPLDFSAGEAALLGRFVPAEFFDLRPSTADSGWDRLNTGDCLVGEPNVWMAVVQLDRDVTLRVNAVICHACLAPVAASPYTQPDGLRTIVQGLVPFAP
jgi:hypothetical protein